MQSTTKAPSSRTSTNWIPYTLVATALICFLIIICCSCSAKCRSFLACFFCCRCCQRHGVESAEYTRTLDKPIDNQSGSQSQSNSLDRIQIKAPTLQPSNYPMKEQLVNTVNTQKYIGGILAQGRRPPPMTYRQSPFVAPPAAKAVARTVKIIGDMLSIDSPNRRRRK